MSDRTIREGFRLASVSDDVETRARALVDQLRSGERSLGDAQVLAYIGDPVALAALGEPPPEVEGEDAAVLWMRGFRAWGDDVLARAVVAWLWSDLGSSAGSGLTRAPFVGALDQWWSDNRSGSPVVAGSWTAGLGATAMHLHMVVRAHAAGEPTTVEHSIEQALRGEPHTLPAPALVVPRLVDWIEASRPGLRPLPGTGPVWRRAIEAATPSDRRALVTYLRSWRRRDQPVSVLVQARPHHLMVDSVGYVYATGFLDGSPMMRISLDHVSIP